MGLFRRKKNNNDKISVKNKDGTVVQTERTVLGTKIPKTLSVDEKSDFYFDLHNSNTGKLYKLSILLMAATLLCLMFTFFYLLVRGDSKFYATSADGRVIELNTREVPNGNFNIKPHKDNKR